MPVIAAFECSSDFSSVALLVDGEVDERVASGHAAAKSKTLLAELAELLARRRLAMEDVSVLAFGSGPGAFTGVRVACSLAQGLAAARCVRVAPVCSLDALAADAGVATGGRIVAAMDARLDQIYLATYVRTGDGLLREREPACMSLGEFELPAGDWSGVGSAFRLEGPVFSPRSPGSLRTVAADAFPRAARVAVSAAASPGTWQDPADVAPLYVRDKVAMTVAERAARGLKR